jgi:uncharacterized protein
MADRQRAGLRTGLFFDCIDYAIAQSLRQMHVMNDPIASPCIRICCLDDANVCIGCGRTLDEIRLWSEMSEQEKSETLRCAVVRREARKQRSPF